MKTLLEKMLVRFAIVNRGFDQVNLRGSVGAVTYRRVGGETIASQKVPPKQTFKPTWALMYRRMLWPNLVALFRSLNVVGWHPSFMGKAPRVSDFNEFMARNVSNTATRVFLNKSDVESDAAVAAPVLISRGDLPEIVCEEDAERESVVSNLAIGALNIGASTTIGAFSKAIVDNNSGFLYGDQITAVCLLQSYDANTGMPKVRAECAKVVLSEESEEFLSETGFQQLVASVNGYLGIRPSISGGACFVHSRDVPGGETRVSSQSIVIFGGMPQTYQSLSAFEAAAMSYGGVRSAQYLTPRSGADEVFPQE